MPQPGPESHDHEPDVFLDVPDLHVDEIRLDVEDLEAHLALQARLANLLQVRAGAHVAIEKVELEILGVGAVAQLKVRLENLYAILDRALTTIDRNPQIVEGVLETAGGALQTADDAIEGVARAVGTRHRRPRLARLGEPLRRLRPRGGRIGLATKVGTAVGMVGGAAIAAQSNGGVEKTLKQLTS